jgi:hypothetical protein
MECAAEIACLGYNLVVLIAALIASGEGSYIAGMFLGIALLIFSVPVSFLIFRLLYNAARYTLYILCIIPFIHLHHIVHLSLVIISLHYISFLCILYSKWIVALCLTSVTTRKEKPALYILYFIFLWIELIVFALMALGYPGWGGGYLFIYY